MRRIGSWAYALCFISLTLVWGGCDSRPEPVVGDEEVRRAGYLIEQKQYSEAIYVLSDRIRHQPEDKRARLILASAYAARAGISLSSYSSFASELAKWKKIDDILPESDDKGFVQSVAKAAVRVQLMVRAFQAIPSPASLAAAEDARMALRTLDEAGTLAGGPSLYRALLRIIVFKQDVFLINTPKIERGCLANPDEVSTWLQALLGSLEAIFRDVSHGLEDPEAKSVAQDFAVKMREIIQAIDPARLHSHKKAVLLQLPPSLKMMLGPCE